MPRIIISHVPISGTTRSILRDTFAPLKVLGLSNTSTATAMLVETNCVSSNPLTVPEMKLSAAVGQPVEFPKFS